MRKEDIFEKWKEEYENKPFYKKWWIHIKGWWKYDIMPFPFEITQGFKNLKYWLPIIWRDRDWDYDYVYNILKHKLKSKSKFFKNHSFYVGAENDAKWMDVCIRLINKIQTEYYQSEYMDYMEDKFWFDDTETPEGYSELKSKITEDNLDEYFKKYPLIYKKALNGEGRFAIIRTGEEKNDRQKIAICISYINYDRAKRLLFKILEEKLETWWD